MEAALARKDYDTAIALGWVALAEPETRLAALRGLVHATLGAGRLEEAAHYAARLVQGGKITLDVILEGVVALSRGELHQAAGCFTHALEMDGTHPLAAVGLFQALSGSREALAAALDRLVPALSWNAETNDTCLAALRGLVAGGAVPAVVYTCAGRIEGIAAAPGVRAELIWKGLTVDQATLVPDQRDPGLCLFTFTVPTDLAGNAQVQVTVNGMPVPGMPLPAAMTRPPRLLARFTRISASATPGSAPGGDAEWSVLAWDAAHPARPVALDLVDRDGQMRRLVFRPEEEGARPAEPQTVSVGQGVRPLFPFTGEPAYWQGGALPGEDAVRPRAPVSGLRRPVDIIVPVYGDAAVTRACLAALRDSMAGVQVGPSVEVIVIADAPADAAVTALVDEVATEGWATVLRNPGNLGFVRTVNRGMALHPDRDVVLLNADAMVHGDWLARLAAAAYRDAAIGTVTPLSNDATILSYPDPEGTQLAEVSVPFLDGLAATALSGKVADVPTGVGFCFYIRRDCLDDVGYFDAETFGRGYGEENDFCWRARARGWRNVAALDTLVGHVGGSSFGGEKADRIAAALALLDQRHPDYQAAVHAFIAANPLLPARRALDVAWARTLGPQTCLLLCPVLGGGTDRFVDGQVASLMAQGIGVVVLRPEGWGDEAGEMPRVRLEIAGAPRLQSLVYEGLAALPDLLRNLQTLGVGRMVVHHVKGVPAVLLAMLAGRWAYDVHIHDYVWYCPRINLVDGSDRYCGEPAVAVCEACVRDNGHFLRSGDLAGNLPVATWRRSMAALLAGAQRVICPTQDTARRLAAQFPGSGIRLAVQPHPDREIPAVAPRPARPSMVRVAVVGAIGDAKGHGVLLACARDARARALPLEFLLVGYSRDNTPLLETGRVRVTGVYAADEAVDLVRAYQAHLGFLPSVWPETWSYTLTEMLAAGLAVAAFDLGAQAERLRMHGRGMLLPLGMTAPRINDALLELARRQGIVPSADAGTASA
ncbi:glycosyltransferase [Nitrospirillum viridazoti]|uniref:GT2 family glycosyltransferase n=1 Tax=Nitrospirillum amazonense TaxID=28077 RepID=A0A560I0S8_9PROT|nr:glycosyltransferase [Nitrospirillum amazonense]TWB51469.1 GT2 family glycosyltransferase [Nitrospirillum amazonense]